ncbi:hypothetical protein CC1G_13122 [Coprinopsis cinerea okayama7|uniref:Uncharacterized protein n=1 Tax=Coprinopsis cinerea (strain Okayama-7 / 130 / ATCC MYA-4618 / FGSC 9003) TaxID=240176 RepID=A8P8Y9_COPC7|nr:hypothetical protein CC1G_13122 [Coprinopsis cinerea okayama7\|eukprot:XP_001839665.2 hypothetical protein CC1G_13122 [Coprinopsis cinerea okayama7\
MVVVAVVDSAAGHSGYGGNQGCGHVGGGGHIGGGGGHIGIGGEPYYTSSTDSSSSSSWRRNTASPRSSTTSLTSEDSSHGSATSAVLRDLEAECRHDRNLPLPSARVHRSATTASSTSTSRKLPNPHSTPSSPILINNGGQTALYWDFHPTSVEEPEHEGPGKGVLGWTEDDEEILVYTRGRSGDAGVRRGLLTVNHHHHGSSGSLHSIHSMPSHTSSSMSSLGARYAGLVPGGVRRPLHDKFILHTVPEMRGAEGYYEGGPKQMFVVKLKNRSNQSMLDPDSRYPVFKKRPSEQSRHRPEPIYVANQPYPTPSMNPNLNANNQPYSIHGEREWSTDLSAVCDDNFGTFCLAMTFPSIVYGRNKARVEHLRTFNRPLDASKVPTVSKDGLTHAVLGLICLAWPLQMSNRKSIRNRYDIQGNAWKDLAAVLCCSGCELAQESREIDLEERALLEREAISYHHHM